jgi:hypothetical protein
MEEVVGDGGVVRGYCSDSPRSLGDSLVGLSREMRLNNLFLFDGVFGLCGPDEGEGELSSSSALEEASDQRDSQRAGAGTWSLSCSRMWIWVSLRIRWRSFLGIVVTIIGGWWWWWWTARPPRPTYPDSPLPTLTNDSGKDADRIWGCGYWWGYEDR